MSPGFPALSHDEICARPSDILCLSQAGRGNANGNILSMCLLDDALRR
jgi:hypothetical protein